MQNARGQGASHATGGSKVPEGIQNKAPQGLEESLPNNCWKVISARSLWQSGYPFVKISEISVQSLQALSDKDISREINNIIYAGEPSVIQGFDQLKDSRFHRCFSVTVAVNLMVDSDGNDPGSIRFGTDRAFQHKYDRFMDELGKSAHTDWTNLYIDKLRSADFPIYVTDQGPGDLIVFPSATAHQVWNISSLVTRVAWNMMHTSSLELFFDYVQPAYQTQCHPDTGRIPLIPLYALQSDSSMGEGERRLLRTFRSQVDDDVGQASLSIKTCGNFDLCLTCFLSGRSCKHVADYIWAEMIPRSLCEDLVQAAETRFLPGLDYVDDTRQTTIARRTGSRCYGCSAERLCHLCCDGHPACKGAVCAQCSTFFSFRGLHRHFDIDIISFLKNKESWNCLKYLSQIKPIDPRRSILGFIDNMFNQKRGKKKKSSLVASSASSQPAVPARGVKRTAVHAGRPLWQDGESITAASTGPRQTRRADSNIFSPQYSTTPDRNNPKNTPREPGPPRPFRRHSQVEARNPTPEQSSRQLARSTPYTKEEVDSFDNLGGIPAMERRRHTIRRYADDITTELGLIESRATIAERISQLKAELGHLKRAKAEKLLRNLDRDFPDLANVAREEARRLGL
ncbi:hypothetical protein BJY00DRAFT_323599 [Aspergillus carlsbadensis]|nr:hypothetical protein BJY00DRAFT_323599 [Aspergillus carlsbadensis]